VLRFRIIPALLLKNEGLVKTIRFKEPTYVGDPINAVRIFNDKEVDEILFLDIMAGREQRRPNFKMVEKIAGECFMPFAYGGGVRSLEDVRILLNLGTEKVVINSYAADNPGFVREAAETFGSQSIVVSIDVKTGILGRQSVHVNGGKTSARCEPVAFAKLMEEMGAGEIVLTSIDRDGTMKGYDLQLLQRVVKALTIPVVASGGAGRIEHFKDALACGASAVSAGSMFVFQGRHRAVLISYPSMAEMETINQQRD
jgi:imidazole glycerol-phosphate synthase subunit HisF